MIYLTAIGCKPGGSVTRLQTEITYNNNNQHQQYIEQTIYTTLGGRRWIRFCEGLQDFVFVALKIAR